MNLTRRQVIQGVGATSVVGFDPVRRAWLTEAQAAPCGRLIDLPRFEGTLSVDASDLDSANRDFGAIRFGTAVAVLRPAHAEDIARAIRYAQEQGIGIAMRGQAHSVFGQAQTDCGVVVDSRALATIHEIGSDSAWVDAGVRWSTLVRASLAEGRTPPVLTDYLELSVGGVISMGGIGGASNRFGLVTDTITEFEIVTGRGQVLLCSQHRNRRLYQAARGGLGQFGIITKARVALVPANDFARVYELQYSDRATFLRDMRKLSGDERFDFLEGQLVPAPDDGRWQFLIQAARWYSSSDFPDDSVLLDGLKPDVRNESFDQPYLDWLNRVAEAERFFRSVGVWTSPHPWSDLFLADETLETYLDIALAETSPSDLGLGLSLFYPMKRRNIGRSATVLPRTKTVWAFDLLRFPIPTGDPAVDGAEVTRLLEQNQILHAAARRLGGKRYAIGAVDFSETDWQEHFGRTYRALKSLKHRLDPHRVLAPGVGVFR